MYWKLTMLIVLSLLGYSCGNTQTDVLENENFMGETYVKNVEIKKGDKTIIYELYYQGPDPLDAPDITPSFTVNTYPKGQKDLRKEIYKHNQKAQDIVSFKVIENTIETKDLDNDGEEELYFVYLYQMAALKPVDVNVLSFINGKDLLVNGHKTIKKSTKGEIDYFTKSYDQRFADYPSVFKKHATDKFDTFVIENGDKDPFLQPGQVRKGASAQKVGSNRIPDNPIAAEFDQLFPVLTESMELKEETIDLTAYKKISAAMAQNYICDVEGSDLECILSAAESETPDGIDITNNFRAIGKYITNGQTIYFYALENGNFPRVLAATYLGNRLLSRISFMGNNSSTKAIHGKIDGTGIEIFMTEFEYGKKNNPKYFKGQVSKRYTLNQEGLIVDNEGKIVGDKAF